ncbi:S8 family serine peptidase [Leptolyngbya sp. 7M]|uniref:S8 family serine peptidase n=1 Tax=Leptolyngbya sp. 7M TaxID=2812896 RepID=UPI001B8BDFCE|nr:S8 family serine peptidase [Leptolyngbya sp. 7M]QYO66931.1 S8 family serine peptidase [Leptolyngbya sp. 7M]
MILFGRIVVVVVLLVLFIGGLFLSNQHTGASSGIPEPIFHNDELRSLGLRTIRDLEHARYFVGSGKKISFPQSKTQVFTWSEFRPSGPPREFYAISLDGEHFSKVSDSETLLRLRFAEFDPVVERPIISGELTSKEYAGKQAYIVQFVSQPLEEFRFAIQKFGGRIFTYLPENAYIIHLDSSMAAAVRSLPFVRWLEPYHPAFKLDPAISDVLAAGQLNERRYNIMVLERGSSMKDKLAGDIVSIGGTVYPYEEQGFRLEAQLTDLQLLNVIRSEDVLFVDEWSPPENDMDVVRSTGGANFVESTAGFRGEGVRAEIMDNGLRQTHSDFNSGLSPIIHNSSNTNEGSNHGTSTYGIVFARGTSNPAGRGMLPEAQGIFADYDFLGSGRYAHTARLVNPPYNAVFQSNSWGSALTTNYTTISAEIDDILFINDIILLQSQSNAGNQNSRPQAWAKNAVSIGGIRHYNTADFQDDRWQSGASTGPAADGRLKPDLAHFYDSIFTTHNSSDSAYTTGFGGTSAATPITAGHFGIFFQMWHNGIFGNPVSTSVFASRPKMSTAKAMMINTAIQWDMTISGTDITRARQGFGRANVQNLYDLRNKMRIVNETDVLTNLQTRTYFVNVPTGSADPLKATLVYTDPMGSPGASQARINDITLRVTSPGGTVYWGNVGLNGTGMWSTAGGSANTVDTVENVFIQSPASGTWTVEVIGSAINQDARPETPGVVDADFALVVSGISPAAPTSANITISGRVATKLGTGIGNISLTLTDSEGNVRQARTNSFGFFAIDEVAAGRSYILSVNGGKRQVYPATVQIDAVEDVSDIAFRVIE